MPDDVVPVPITDGPVRRLFEDPEFRVTKRGYHPDDVVAFLDGIGTRMVNLIERLQAAEKAAKATQAELDDHRLRVEQAESSAGAVRAHPGPGRGDGPGRRGRRPGSGGSDRGRGPGGRPAHGG